MRMITLGMLAGLLSGCLWGAFGELVSKVNGGDKADDHKAQFHEGHCAPEKIYRCSHSVRCCFDCMYSCP